MQVLGEQTVPQDQVFLHCLVPTGGTELDVQSSNAKFLLFKY